MNQSTNKKIGILDGMGAFAGARFFQLVLEKITDQKLIFPEIILDAVSIDDFISDQTKIKPALQTLSTRVRHFNRINTTLNVMVCNTAHIFHPELVKISHSPFPSLIDLVTTQVKHQEITRIGILASPTTLKTKLYENKLRSLGLHPVIPDKKFQILLEQIIRGVITNSNSQKAIDNFVVKTNELISLNNLEGIILGCTELPLVFPKTEFSHIKIFDSLDILADSIIDHLKC